MTGRFFDGLESALLFVFSLALGYLIGTSITLYSGDPYDILNVNNIGYGWSPDTNYVQVLAVVAATALIFWGAMTLRKRGRRAGIALRVLTTGFSALVVVLARVVPPIVNTGFSDYDSFHYGEQLSPAAAFLAGKTPFTDIFVLHGAGEDIFKPALGFVLFGDGTPSIGSYLLISAVFQSLAVLGFFILIALLVRTRWLYLAITLWSTMTTFEGFAYSKNVAVIVFLVLLWVVATRPLRGITKLILLAAAGFIASITILDSIDVGALMGALSAALAVMMVFVTVTPDGLRFGRPRFGLRSLAPGLALTLGVVLAQLVILIALGGSAYIEFLKVTFVEIPRYQGLMWGAPMPTMNPEIFVFWLPLFAMAATVPLLAMLVRRDHRRTRFTLAPETVLAVVLLGLAIIYSRFAIGRPDVGHIIMAAPFMLLSSLYATQLAIAGTRLDHPFTVRTTETEAQVERVPLWPAALISITLIFTPTVMKPVLLFVDGAPAIAQLRQLKNLPNRPDASWLNENQRAIIDFVDQNTSADESIFVFQPDPSYYFLTDRLNPTRFANSWFIDPEQFTQEALADLKADPPALVLWDTTTVFADSDGIPIADRFPEIAEWIEQNYPVEIRVGDSTIRSKAPIPTPSS